MSFRGRSQLDLMLHLATLWQINCGKGARIYQKGSILLFCDEKCGLFLQEHSVDQDKSSGQQVPCPQGAGRALGEQDGSSWWGSSWWGSRGGACSECSQWEHPEGASQQWEQQTPLGQPGGSSEERQQGTVAKEKYQDQEDWRGCPLLSLLLGFCCVVFQYCTVY